MLLSRTADNLYWMARYIERAECTARLVDVGRRMTALLPDPSGVASEWSSTIEAAGCEASFLATGGPPNAEHAINHLVRDMANPSSIFASLTTVRQNARAVRTALSADVWDAVNSMWIEAQAWRDEDFTAEGVPQILDWVKERSQRFGGAVMNTMLRQEAYWWVRLGTFLERAENTARIVDVKYHVLLPQVQDVGGLHDYYQWGSVLRAVSAFRAYHWVYRGRLEPARVAELMILRPELPRSIISCVSQVNYYLDRISSTVGSIDPSEDEAPTIPSGSDLNSIHGNAIQSSRKIEQQLRLSTIEMIMTSGLHEYLTEFISSVNNLGADIRREFLLT